VEKLTEEKEKLKVLNSHDPQCFFYCDGWQYAAKA
jgi:hypothetical protein